MTQTQSYVVAERSPISGGSAMYVADFQNSLLTVKGLVTAKVLFFSHTVPFGQSYVCNPDDLLSAGLKVGVTRRIGGATVKVLEAVDRKSSVVKVGISVEGQQMMKTCFAWLDTSGTYVRVLSVIATAKAPVVGEVTIQLSETQAFSRPRMPTSLGRLYSRLCGLCGR